MLFAKAACGSSDTAGLKECKTINLAGLNLDMRSAEFLAVALCKMPALKTVILPSNLMHRARETLRRNDVRVQNEHVDPQAVDSLKRKLELNGLRVEVDNGDSVR